MPSRRPRSPAAHRAPRHPPERTRGGGTSATTCRPRQASGTSRSPGRATATSRASRAPPRQEGPRPAPGPTT
eukprot:13588174-Alexandrium_andersonii.AAC.1